MIKYSALIFFLILASTIVIAQQSKPNADQLREQMFNIRQTADWNDPVKAKEANAKIKELSNQLMILGQEKKQQNTATPDSSKAKEEVEFRKQLLDQMIKSADQGEEADILLAEPLREEIVEEYKEEESPKNIRPEFLQEMPVLVIDMSVPTVQRTIDIMQNYTSVQTLVITGGEHGAPVNLPDLLQRAAHFPLQTLYIINFRQFLTTIPEQINQFKNLSTLAVFNNKIGQLPPMNGFSSQLDSLFVDANPVSTLFPAISTLSDLKTLCIANTNISEAEINKIRQLFPKCQIRTK
jgi:hypothetical protein